MLGVIALYSAEWFIITFIIEYPGKLFKKLFYIYSLIEQFLLYEFN